MSKQLEERFLGFALRVRNFCQQLKWNVINQEYIKQLVRCSGSVGANYIEASDDLGKQDERMKIKISRREAKESLYWLSLVLIHENAELEQEKLALIDEGTQIVRILSSILQKLETNAR
ncbi:MAG: four helix bundle protein [Chitinophagaceae bacterium]